jgi:uncharacterized protein (DUF2164 family)
MIGPVKIKLSEERRGQLAAGIQRFFDDEFELELSDFQARRLLDYLIRHLGAPIYNQAVQDARAFVQAKLDDLEGEIYEPEEPR